ncbi:hypothetical protein [Halorubrum sp. LN27]|nr:hypothetical protein [Halorubrum sp. LN27]
MAAVSTVGIEDRLDDFDIRLFGVTPDGVDLIDIVFPTNGIDRGTVSAT